MSIEGVVTDKNGFIDDDSWQGFSKKNLNPRLLFGDDEEMQKAITRYGKLSFLISVNLSRKLNDFVYF